MSKIILHIDLNAFFVRCEELKNPSLEGKPVIIGRVGRGGIVSTCSYAARKFGVKSGMPTYEALLKCKNAIVLDVDFNFYHEKSKQFFAFLKKYTNLIEPASVDECFADFTEVLKNEKEPLNFLRNLQKDLFEETGLKCSIGVAPTKFLAKMASDMKKPLGLVVIRKRDAKKKLSPLPIEDFFGIGKKTAPHLRQLGINTIGDLITRIDNEDQAIKRELGKFYFVIKDWINGKGDDEINTEPFDPKSIGHSTTLYSDALSVEELEKPLRELSKEVSEDAQKRGKKGKAVQLVLKDNEFKVINRSKRLNKLTNSFDDIFNTAFELLKDNYDGRPTRLIGVTLQQLKNPKETYEQLSIFDNFEEIKEENETRLLIGDLNRKMHKSVFKTAADHLRETGNDTKRSKWVIFSIP